MPHASLIRRATYVWLAFLVACGAATPPVAPATPPPVAPLPTSTASYDAPWYVAGVTVEVFAGTGVAGFKDGPATEAQFDLPDGLAVDRAGNVYVFDWRNARVRRISPEGVVTTLAGSGVPGYADGPGAQAQFRGDARLALDPAGNLVLADGQNHRIRLITPDGLVSTLAGTGEPGYRDGPAGQALLNQPVGVAIDAVGTVYVADAGNNRLRRIAPDGNVSTLAGTGNAGSADGPALAAEFDGPNSLAVDAAGNLVVAEGLPWEFRGTHRLRRVAPDGTVTTLAGSGRAGQRDGPAPDARFAMLTCPALDAAGNVIVADYGNVRIRMVTPDGLVYTVAGTGEPGVAVGPGDAAQFADPSCLAIGPQGEAYVADPGSHRILRLTFSRKPVAPLPTATPNSRPAVRIGYVLLFHNEVPTRLYQAARLAVDEANAAGGVTVGGQAYALELVVAQDCCGPEGGAHAAQSLIEQNVVAVVGHALSDSAIAASPIYAQAGLVHITPTAQDPRLTFAGQPNAYRVAPNAAYGAPAGARLAYQQLGIRRAALLVEPYEFQRQVAAAWQTAFEALGGTVFEHAVTPENVPAVLDAIRTERAEALVIVRPQVLDLPSVLRQAHEAGLNVPVIGYLIQGVLSNQPPPEYEGLYDLTAGRPPGAMPGYESFAARYRAEQFALAPEPNEWAAFAYDATRLAIAAIRQAATTGAVTRSTVAAAMTTFQAEPFEGLTGSIQFDDRGDRLDQPFYFGRWVDGQWVAVAPP